MSDIHVHSTGLYRSSPGVPGVPWHTQIFGRSVNPISTMGNRLCPPIYYWHTRIFRPSNGPDADVIGMLEPRYLSTMVLGHKNQFKSSLLFESNKIQWIFFYLVKLRHYEKATKLEKFSHLFWKNSSVKINGRFFHIFVAFSENLNIMIIALLLQKLNHSNVPFVPG